MAPAEEAPGLIPKERRTFVARTARVTQRQYKERLVSTSPKRLVRAGSSEHAFGLPPLQTCGRYVSPGRFFIHSHHQASS